MEMQQLPVADPQDLLRHALHERRAQAARAASFLSDLMLTRGGSYCNTLAEPPRSCLLPDQTPPLGRRLLPQRGHQAYSS
jgi:hypothetical protein